MTLSQNATAGANTGGGAFPQGAPRELPAMLSVDDVSAMLGCSTRHVYRMSDMERMPRPIKLGALVRWSRRAILEWIDAGCPSCRRGVRR
jgi:predicted DNA-binding transcriptional regulator AlpA